MILRATTLLLAFLCAQERLQAQASFIESFDNVGRSSGTGPDGLVAKGWTFRNQSDPVGVSGWYDGWLFAPHTGAGYLAVDESSTSFFGGDISTWAILPAIPDQIAGDALTVYVQGSVAPEDRLELRYSPTGAIATGSGVTDVGDFTTLLIDVPLQNGGWSPVNVVLPGSGRIAFRYVVENACNFTCSASSLGFDELVVGSGPPPACNQPPLPAAGETVVWTKDGGPWEVCADLLIPIGARVVVEAGATVTITSGSHLTVNGEISFDGLAGQPVYFNGDANPFGVPPIRIAGLAEVRHADVRGLLYCEHGGTLTVADSTFTGAGVWTANLVGGPPNDTAVRIERCSVVGADVYVEDGTLVAHDTSLINAGIGVSRGYSHLRNVTVDGGPVSLYRQDWAQPGYLNDLTVVNSSVGGLVLDGSDFFVGSNNTLAANFAPVRLTGGLVSGSTVPTSGNVNDYVDVLDGSTGGPATWSKVAVPYVVGGIGIGGRHVIEPGVTVKFKPGAGLLYQGGLRARGNRQDPIRFESFVPGSKWELFKFQAVTSTVHFEHCVFDESKRALQSDNSVVFVDNGLFTRNDYGAWVNTSGIWVGRGTQFLGNQVAAHLESGQLSFNGTQNSNAFIGNGIGIEGGSGTAMFNWWGDPSGPTHPANPGGMGDAATASVQVLPFLQAPPNFEDTPPQVTILAGAGLLLEGEKTLLAWRVDEDSALSSQRIQYSPTGNLTYSTVAQLEPGVRSFEFTAPEGPTGQQGFSFLRVVAVDDAGQEGWDERTFSTPYTKDVPGGPPSLTFLTDLSGGFTMGDEFSVDYAYSGAPASMSAAIVLDSDGVSIGQGGFPSSLGTWSSFRAPYASTDQARVALTVQHGNNRFFQFFSEPFEVRPHPLVPDAPPTITLVTPLDGQSFKAGTNIPVAWMASDDEALRQILVQISYTGATWHTLATLPGEASSWSFPVPNNTGIADVQLRVVAVDERFQNRSSSTTFHLLPGPPQQVPRRGPVLTQP